ncbi:HD domain-containing protein [Heliobacterium gestii]|uniref:HD domain-containing protein n=1 Tax=Heliomicrobium gestii TaxID=2699 RepID=A0A845LDW5_HELGE|nr:HD domain-containing phosphohydrolase [Heliomicrobium gestii]MBM7866396.1 HD-GYP domain-containing protein (c-di-GMP phosphodiesterase class II) [Heliomicrobium gestii]MZP42819.1 HD domain-containing protein [Heliomicrobium gestii]
MTLEGRTYKSLLAETHKLLEKLADHDQPSLTHTQDVARVVRGFLPHLGITGEQAQPIVLAALLHDIGKLRVASDILQKPHGIDPIEQILIQVHSAHGESLIRDTDLFPPEVAQMIGQHHEHLDGSGYPNGLKGDAIVYGARIIGICDIFAMTQEDRITQKGRTLTEAIDYLKNRESWFDPAVFRAFMEYAASLAATGSEPAATR